MVPASLDDLATQTCSPICRRLGGSQRQVGQVCSNRNWIGGMKAQQEERNGRLMSALDAIQGRFGKAAIARLQHRSGQPEGTQTLGEEAGTAVAGV